LQYDKYTVLNKLTLQKGIAKNIILIMLFGRKNKNTTTTKQKSKHKNPCQSRKLKPGPLAPQSGLLPLGHQVN